MSSRSVQYTSSPLLASKTPIWRSQFIVAVIAAGFLGLVARAAYVQVIDNAFFKRQGTVRFVRTLDLPANRGRILDRNGNILASSVPVRGITANPEEIDRDPVKLKALAKLLDITQHSREVYDRRAPFAAPKVMDFKAIDRIKPSADEVAGNPRSRSAIMRVAQRLGSAA